MNVSKIRREILKRFDLLADKAANEEIISSIDQSVEFKGANLWILIFAIGLASVGLNINSTAVVIGAMLISPLMGPILGLGVGVAILDFDLIKRSFKSYGFAVLSSIAASTIYFLISPLSEAKSELLARTTPTVWDILIAFFGGLAGIIAYSRQIKTNVIPGVAIATALMPPLCTVGYGISHGSWRFTLGAFYLFFINSVFICLATILISRLLRLPKKDYVDPLMRLRIKQMITLLVVITALPSFYLSYRIVKTSIEERNAGIFLEREFNFRDVQILERKMRFDQKPPEIILTLIGRSLSPQQIEDLQHRLALYGLANVHLTINQALDNAKRPEELVALKSEILKDFY